MTKEELKKEAEEYYEDETEGTFQICEDCYWFADAVQTAYVDSAEPREKQIQIDAEQIRALQKQNGELTDKVKELENAIEGYKNQIFYKEKALAKVKKEKDRIVHRVTKDKKRLIRRNIEYKAQIEKMKCDVLSLIKDRMNDDIDQNIIERLAEKWELKELRK